MKSEQRIVYGNGSNMKQADILLVNVEIEDVVSNVVIRDNVIESIGEKSADAKEVIDCRKLWVFPGVIDPHVHMRDLAQSYKEDWESGSAAAIRGGVTTVFDMPNNVPPIINTENLELKRKAARKGKLNYLLYLGATNSNRDELRRILDGEPDDIAGIKVFLAASSTNEIMDNVKELRRIFELGKEYNRIITVHTELQKFIAPRYKYPLKIENHNTIRDRKAAITGLEICLTLARNIGNKLYIAHVSTVEELEMIRKEKAIGQNIYCEISPHHLLLDETICPQMGNFAKVNPPLRTKDDNAALWEAISDYTVDTIGSDHAPHHLKEKKCAYSSALSGFPGLETTVPLLATCVNKGKLSKGRMVDLLSRKAAYIFGLNKMNGLKEGNAANLTIIDPAGTDTISGMKNLSKAKYTPFEGRKTKGQVVYTIVKGELFKCEERRKKV
ncbi:MAG: dihydroorotase family protein [Candidatus Cloacimonetes bacterium]|nr:dihydroorotase family protein [Candidatus Cloacimonadota bacterium]